MSGINRSKRLGRLVLVAGPVRLKGAGSEKVERLSREARRNTRRLNVKSNDA